MLVQKCGNYRIPVVSPLKLNANHACWLRDVDCGVRVPLQLDGEGNIPGQKVTGGPGEFFLETVPEKKRMSGIARRS